MVEPTEILWLKSCESSNDQAWEMPKQFKAVGTDQQTQGRGRLRRPWHSPPGCGLYLSWRVQPRFPISQGGALPLLAAVALVEICESLGVFPELKWPNDLLLRGAKLGGILSEARSDPKAWSAVVGLGLNLKTPSGGYPEEIPGIALDSQILPPTAYVLAPKLLTQLESWLEQVTDEGMSSLIAAWSARSIPLGSLMRQGQHQGSLLGLAPDGALRLQTQGAEVLIHAGDVEMLSRSPLH